MASVNYPKCDQIEIHKDCFARNPRSKEKCILLIDTKFNGYDCPFYKPLYMFVGKKLPLAYKDEDEKEPEN